MPTYYMQGSMSPEKSVEFFESFFLSVQQIIELDNNFNIELEKHFVDDDNEAQDEYYNIEELKSIQNKIIILLADCESRNNHENANFLSKAFYEFVSIYRRAYGESYKKIISTMKNDDVSEQQIESFNTLLHSIGKELNKALSDFYESADVFANEFDIELS